MTTVLDTRGDLLVNTFGQVIHTLDAREVHEGLDALTQFPPQMYVGHPIYLHATVANLTSDADANHTIAISLKVNTVLDVTSTRIFQGDADSSIICVQEPGKPISQLFVKLGSRTHEVDMNGSMQVVATTSLRNTQEESIGAWDNLQEDEDFTSWNRFSEPQ